MDYFKLLELDKEPFSNSPGPEFFFESAMHLQCLQQLEMALRLKRGLSVVLGRVGTGKSTICRQLLRRCSHDPAIGVNLVLDPSFDSPRQFIEQLTQLFKIDGPDMSGKEPELRLLKERLKKYLFTQGVEKNRITLLIIDEGQKLSLESLELLRELLNYETNQNKLLQIIIFAQEEFNQKLAMMPNFKDRINLFYHLLPLSFAETREMIRFRLSQAHPEQRPPVKFTYPALWLIHRATGGYPRRIIHLCHKVILALIIQGRTTAGARVVRFAARSEGIRPSRLLHPAFAALLIILLLAGGWSWSRLSIDSKEFRLQELRSAVAASPVTKLESDPNVSANFSAVQPETPVAMKLPPEELEVEKLVSEPNFSNFPANFPQDIPRLFLLEDDAAETMGTITVQERDILSRMLVLIFALEDSGRLNQLLKKTVALNPELRNPNLIVAGQTLLFPYPGREFAPSPGYWLELARLPDMDHAFAFLRRHEQDLPLRLALAVDREQNRTFSILLNRHFSGILEAEAARFTLAKSWHDAIEVTAFLEKSGSEKLEQLGSEQLGSGTNFSANFPANKI